MKNGHKFYPSFASGLSTCTTPEIQNSTEKINSVDLDKEISGTTKEAIDKSVQDSISFKDKLMYIFTSGTTGMPKAAIIKQSR